MKLVLPIAACLIAIFQWSTATAQTYQWKDSSGRTIISDTPPPASAKGTRAVQSSADADAAAPKTMAEKDLEFKKRQQANREKADKEAKELAAAGQRKEDCNQARRYLASLESGERIATRDDQGERRFLEDAERQQEMDRSRKIVANTCK